MIPKKFIPYVITDIGTFNTTKFAANESNTTYFLGSDQDTVLSGAPDVLYDYFSTITPVGLIYTHGKLFDGSINQYIKTNSMTEDAYWDIVAAGTVQSDTLYITFDNDWEG